jgi:thiol-disulfide isomerase/thioredoxin
MLPVLGLLLFFSVPALAGEVFPDVILRGVMSDAQKAYLGVSAENLKLSDIKADYVFVEVYSMYCPICQRDAPKVEEIYTKVGLTGRGNSIKFIGIGAGNTPFEINFYRNKFKVAFPLFEDPDYIIHKALGDIGTPSFYLIKLKGGSMEILFFQEGEILEKDVLFKTIMDTITQ